MVLSHAFANDGLGKGEFMSYSRFAIYYVPPAGALTEFGASWLGWDVIAGCDARQPDVPGLNDITMTPRKYGFHGTLKPPFRLTDGRAFDDLHRATADMAGRVAPGVSDGLDLTVMGRFLALTPRGDTAGLRAVAEACVRDLDGFRAAPTDAELARRRKSNLTARQDALLVQWGYPYVMEEFRFHITLSGGLPKEVVAAWTRTVADHLPDLPTPFVIDQIALCGERDDGRFELIHRYTLAG
jgi:putative phosphonate metabolism protein